MLPHQTGSGLLSLMLVRNLSFVQLIKNKQTKTTYLARPSVFLVHSKVSSLKCKNTFIIGNEKKKIPVVYSMRLLHPYF